MNISTFILVIDINILSVRLIIIIYKGKEYKIHKTECYNITFIAINFLSSPNRSGERNPKFSTVRKSTALGTGSGKWPSESYSDSSCYQHDELPAVSSLPGYHLLSNRERQVTGLY